MDNKLIKAIKGLKLTSAGVNRKATDIYDYPSNVMPKKEDKVYPRLYLNSKNAPDLVGYEVGNNVTIILRGEVVLHEAIKRNKKEKESFEIEIKSLSCVKKK